MTLFTFNSKRRGFTLVELLVVIAIIGTLVGLLLPAVQSAREAANRASCTNKVKQLALGVHQYVSARNKLPAASDRWFSATLSAGSTPATRLPAASQGGWSWIFHILPYFEESGLYDQARSVSVQTTGTNRGPFSIVDPRTLATGTVNGVAADIFANKQMSGLLCPSWRGTQIQSNFGDGSTSSRAFAATNYKAMAGRGLFDGTTNTVTTSAALTVGGYPTDDGYMPLIPPSPASTPSGELNRISMAGRPIVTGDGTSKTIIIAESKEGNPTPGTGVTNSYSTWFYGPQTWVVAADAVSGAPGIVNGVYQGTVNTGLNRGPTNADTTARWNSYGGDSNPVFAGTGANVTMTWGPSSDHSGNVILHGFGDGSVRSIAAEVDPNVYLGLSTVSGGENTPSDF